MKKLIELLFKLLGYSVYKSLPKSPDYGVEQVIDVGVAKGTDILLNNYSRAKFFLFEPNPIYFDLIEKKICTNFDAILFKYGASDNNGMARFKLANLNSSISDNVKDDTIEVMVRTLDDVLLNNKDFFLDKKTLLKIDTEGHELVVLRGAINLLRLARIDYICLELRISGIDNIYNPSEIFVLLNENGFLFERVDKIAFRGSRISYMDVTFKRRIFDSVNVDRS